MDLAAHWLRIRDSLRQRGVTPLLLLLAIGGGAVLLIVASGARFTPAQRVSLDANARFTASDFRTAQSTFRSAGLEAAQFSNGMILVPAERADEYRRIWQPANPTMDRNRWADVWQSANDRLSQFSGSREREAAREISRAQVISRLLEELPDIATADVVWDEAAASGWRRAERARATVYLQAEPGRVIGPDVVDAVRRAVAGSKANLAAEDVTVMDQTRMLTYDGAATASQSQAMQLAAIFRSRMESTLGYIPGVRVQVHVNTASNESASLVPVALAVSIPEASIRTLAGLDATDAAIESGSVFAQRRRDVFRSVEQHIQRAVREQAATLIPAGLVLASPQQLIVETTPGPMVAAPADAKPQAADLVVGWIGQNVMPLTAALCGLSAIWMLRPRRRSAVDSGCVRAVTALERPVIAEALDPLPTLPASAADASSISRESAKSPIDVETPMIAVATTVETKPIDAPLSGGVRHQNRLDRAGANSTHDALRAALSKLEQRLPKESITSSTPVATEWLEGSERPMVFAGRIPAPIRATEPEFELENLTHEHTDIVRDVVRQVDALVWSKALFGSTETLQSRILMHLPPADGTTLERALRTNRPLRLREIDAAQATVRDVWSRLRQELPADDDAPVRSAA